MPFPRGARIESHPRSPNYDVTEADARPVYRELLASNVSMLNHSEDDASNTFLALYVNDSAHGLWKYAEFDPTGKQTDFANPNFYELFDLAVDPHETVNVWYNSSSNSSSSSHRVTQQLRDYLHTTAHATYTCQGTACP